MILVYPRSLMSLVVVEMVSELEGERLLLEVRATRRLEVLRPHVHTDGYVVAGHAAFVSDAPPSGEEAVASVVLGRELRGTLEHWVEEVERRGKERQAGQLRRVLRRLGTPPSVAEPEALGLWAAAVLNPLPGLGLAPEVRISCLRCVQSNQRLQIVLTALEVSLHHVCQPGALQQLGTLLRRARHSPTWRTLLSILVPTLAALVVAMLGVTACIVCGLPRLGLVLA